MNSICLRLIVIIILFLSNGCANGQTANKSESKEEEYAAPEMQVDPFVQNKALCKGVNLGNALEAPSEGEWGMVIEEEYIQLIEDAGFDAVRIPIRWNAHAMQNPPYRIEERFLQRVDEVVGWALERDLMVVINIHHYNELMEEPKAHKERFLSIWGQIARHFEEAPNGLLFEVLNEPHNNLTTALWNEYLADGIDEIRETNPNRTIVIGTANWGGIDRLTSLNIPEQERNVIVTVHYYNPFQFTHQGASWAGEQADEWLGTTWTATESQKAAVDEDFDSVKEWAEQHNRPIYLGEFGVYGAAPRESRETWTDYVRSAAEARDFSWSYWEFGAGFGIFNRDANEWREELLKALIPGSPELN